MNIFTEQKIDDLIHSRSERNSIDFKEVGDLADNKTHQIKIIKDVLALANTKDGGVLLFGIKDNGTPVNISDEDLKFFDQTSFNDKIHKYSSPKFTVNIYRPSYRGVNIAIVEVPEFKEEPILCRADGGDRNGKTILRKGALYIRTEKGTSEEVPSAEEMRELLGRALQKKSDNLLSGIARMLDGRPVQDLMKDRENIFKDEIEDADQYIEDSIGENLSETGFWRVSIHPVDYVQNRLPKRSELKDIVKKNEVMLRGWNFPHSNLDGSSNFNNGIQSQTKFEPRHFEAFRLYKSGLFVWKSAIWEDAEPDSSDGRGLSFVSAIWTMTEFLLFFKRFYIDILELDTLFLLNVSLHNTKGRKLKAYNSPTILTYDYVSNEDNIILLRTLSSIELKTSWKEIANELSSELFELFNCDGMKFDVIEKWQDGLLNRNN